MKQSGDNSKSFDWKLWGGLLISALFIYLAFRKVVPLSVLVDVLSCKKAPHALSESPNFTLVGNEEDQRVPPGTVS